MTTDSTDRSATSEADESDLGDGQASHTDTMELEDTMAPKDTMAPEGDATRRPSLSERFEASRVGKWVISAVILVIIGTQVVWSMPDSPIKAGLRSMLIPTNAANIALRWSMFSPDPSPRIEEFETEVTMADGSTRTWKLEPNSWLEKLVVPDRWEGMREQAMRRPEPRRDFARWIVREVTAPGEQPVKVVMRFNYRVLLRPDQNKTSSTGTRMLYEETLTGRP